MIKISQYTILLVMLSSIIISIVACNEDLHSNDCSEIFPKRIFVNRMDNNGKVSYEHYILLTGYSDNCFATVNFSAQAKKYIDTCDFKRPIQNITFIKSIEGTDFESGEPNFEKALEYELISFMMDSTSIKKIYLVRNGIRKTIEIDNCDFKETFYE